jgi:ureidoacrylate peracid hydrolase
VAQAGAGEIPLSEVQFHQMETKMQKLFGAVLGLAIMALGLVSSNDARAQDAVKLPPLEKTLRPDQTAIVMVDFQNYFASPQGEFYPQLKNQFVSTHMIENSVNLVKAARKLGVLVIHVTEGYTNDYRELDPSNGALFHRGGILRQAWKEGSPGTELYAPIKDEKDIVLPNRKALSGFGGTPLDFILKSRGIRNVAVGGFTADVCVYATLVEGYDLGYHMYAVTDAMVAGDPVTTKEMIRSLYPFISRPMPSAEFLAMLSPSEAKAAAK